MSFLYYSTQSILAHRISERYFKGKFFVYCAEAYDPQNPASSSPAQLYQLFRMIAETDDRGNPKVVDHKTKLKANARRMLAEGKLRREEYDELVWEINYARAHDFAPILYLILRNAVSHKITPVSIRRAASVDSREYKIEDMLIDDFETIRPKLGLSGGV